MLSKSLQLCPTLCDPVAHSSPWNSPKESLSTHYLDSQNFNILLHVYVHFFLNFFRVDGMYHALYPLDWVFLSNKDILLLTIVTEKQAFF